MVLIQNSNLFISCKEYVGVFEMRYLHESPGATLKIIILIKGDSNPNDKYV